MRPLPAVASLGLLPLLVAFSLGHAAGAVGLPAAEPVDLALILAVDVSESVDRQEAAQQRQGYVQAIQAEDVVAAILSGRRGRIAVTYVEWAGPEHFFEIVGWTVIDGPRAARDFAARLRRAVVTQGYTTSLTVLMQRSLAIFERLASPADRRVLDISGDGPNNDGGYILQAREQLMAAGVTINGLPILNDRPAPSGYPRLEDLPAYFRHCVIGGSGAFQVPAESFEAFAKAIRLKLVQEIAGTAPPEPRPLLRLAALAPDYDCTVGERQSRERLRRKFETTGEPRQ